MTVRKRITIVLGYLAMMGGVMYGTLTLLNHLEKRNWNIPKATEMAKTAIMAQQESTSFQELEKRITASIRVDAKKGARSTDVYIEEFETATVEEAVRLLKFRGYKIKWEWSAFSKDKPDFLEISW